MEGGWSEWSGMILNYHCYHQAFEFKLNLHPSTPNEFTDSACCRQLPTTNILYYTGTTTYMPQHPKQWLLVALSVAADMYTALCSMGHTTSRGAQKSGSMAHDSSSRVFLQIGGPQNIRNRCRISEICSRSPRSSTAVHFL